MRRSRKKILIAVIVAIAVVAAVLLWSWWRRGVTAEEADAGQSTVQSQSAPKKKDKKDADEKDSGPSVTATQVREHAQQVSQNMSQLSSYTVPGDQYPTYEYIARNGKFDSMGLTDAENSLRDAVNESLHWDDSHSGVENQEQMDSLDSRYDDWVETLWRTMCDCLSSTVEGLDEQLDYMDTDGMADSCRNVAGMAGTLPDEGSDEQSYVTLRDWMNSVTDGMNQCQADMSAMVMGQ